MKKSLVVVCLFSLAVSLNGQQKADFGVMGGVTSYLGDINPTRLLYAPSPAVGLFYRYNLHPRQSLRFNILYGGIRGNDKDFNNSFQTTRGASFSGTVAEFTGQFEFNFLPYSTMGKVWDYSPYFAAGVGGVYVNSSTSAVVPVIPFSIGFKINIHKNIGLEAEYGFRKTFYDNFDGLKDFVAPSDFTWTHNNDWYTFTGVSVTWKIYNKLAGCPAFNDTDAKRKH
jgi:hypothetical protein